MQLYPDLIKIQKTVYEPCGLKCTNIIIDQESKEYGACEFNINQKKVLFRIAKITPTKNGQFVTFWKRLVTGVIAPFDWTDNIDFFIVTVKTGVYFGQFVFPKNVLLERDIISKNGVGGKRAIRVYPPWDNVDNKQAIKTQAWQNEYFFSIHKEHYDKKRIQSLFV